ncbi:hypothetical protein JCM10213_008127 [Rhodosporidiobolus nylandii]
MAAQEHVRDGEKGNLKGSTAVDGPPTALRELQGEGTASGLKEDGQPEERAPTAATTPSSSTGSSSPSSAPPTLPVELIVLILSHVRRGLAKCTLVSRLFRDLAQPLLLRCAKFKLFPFDDEDCDIWLLNLRSERFVEWLEDAQTRRLVPLVKELHLEFGLLSSTMDVEVQMSLNGEFEDKEEMWQWAEENRVDPAQVLRRVVSALAPHLHALRIENLLDRESALLTSLLRSTAFPRLTSLVFPHLTPALASTFSAVKDLDFSAVEHIPGGSPAAPFALRRLRVWQEGVQLSLPLSLFWATRSSFHTLVILDMAYHTSHALLFPFFTALRFLSIQPWFAKHYDSLPRLPPSLTYLDLGHCLTPSSATSLSTSILRDLPPALEHLALPLPLFLPSLLVELITAQPALRRLELHVDWHDFHKYDAELPQRWTLEAVAALRGACEAR